MTMNTTEANAVQHVLNGLLGIPRLGGPLAEETVLESAVLLADRANRVLMAGPTGAEVRQAWPKPGRQVDRTSPEQIKADTDDAIGDAMKLYRQLSGAPEPGPDDVPLFDTDGEPDPKATDS